MKKIPHKLLKVCRGVFFSLVLFFCIASFPIAFAQQVGIENIAGVCGQTASASDACKLQDIGKITKGVLTVIISVGLPLLVVFVAYRFIIAWFAAQQGQTNAYHDAVSKAKNAILGFMFIIAIFGGLFFVLLQLLGVNNQLFTPLKNILLGASLFPHAYAAETSMLPNFLPYNSLNELLFALIRLVMRFFVYPLLIVIWVWTGFLFVFAQGSPEGLKKAKDLLMKALISSLVIFSIQGFILAAQGTVTKVLGGDKTTTNSVSSSNAELQASCSSKGGYLDSNGACLGALDAAGIQALQNCEGKAPQTVCYIKQSSGTDKIGTCRDTGGKMECALAAKDTPCITSAGITGKVGSNNDCDLGQRPGAGIGGSCRNDFDCSGTLKCSNNLCASASSPLEGKDCLLDKRIAGKYGKDGICHSNTQAPADVSCTSQRGGRCVKKGVVGTCVDWNCVP